MGLRQISIVMNLFRKLFFSSKKETEENKKLSEFALSDKGEITGKCSLNANGKELTVPIKTSVKELNEIETNKSNPNSCEFEPTKEQIIIPVADFFEKYKFGLVGNIGDKIWADYQKAKQKGFNNFVISKYEFDCIIEIQKKLEEKNRILSLTSYLNNKGIALEKEGKIEEAIKIYEENIKLEYPATHSYNRLMVLYRKQKDKENEIRVIKIAICVFLKANQERAERCLERYPERSEEIYNSLATCTNIMGNDGFYILELYNVIKYRNRLNKLISK